MLQVLRTFIKRIPREKFKSLSASALALALVFLISIMSSLLSFFHFTDIENFIMLVTGA